MDIKVIIATHKEYEMPKDSMYVPVRVGAIGKEHYGYIGDDTGEHISEKNPYYCELTGLYWAWKNLDAEYLGLVHYRRHFKGHNNFKNKFDNVLKKEEAEEILKNHKIIVPKKRNYYIETLYSHYAHTHYKEHLDDTEKIIARYYPEYLPAYKEVLNQTYGYVFNMMIMERQYSDAYCEWLFDILLKLEGYVKNIEELSDFQKRLYGRVSELLLNVWLKYQIECGNIKKDEIKEVTQMHMENVNWIEKGTNFLKAKFLSNKYEKSC